MYKYKDERLIVIIPIHNYLEGVLRLEKFARENLPSLFGDSGWHVCLVNNRSETKIALKLEEISEPKNFSLHYQNNRRDLRENLHLGYVKGLEKICPSMISVWETDAIPDISVFRKMVGLLIEERHNKVASVSPMYSLKDKYCHPTRSHWHKDPYWKEESKWGRITKTHATPFLFSLWNPSVFYLISDKRLRPFSHLDTDFGLKTGKQHLHLRLKDCKIEHYKRGRNSRGRNEDRSHYARQIRPA